MFTTGANGGLNFLGNSFSNIQRDMGNGYGLFGSLFGGGIKPEEIDSIKQFNYQLESGVPIGQAWQNTMSGCRSCVKQAAVDVRSGATSLDALEKSATSSTASLIGTRIAATALNMAISMGLVLAIQGIITGLQALADMLPTVENTSKWLEDSSKEVEEHESKIKDLNSELSTTQSRMAELQAKGSLTILEQNELDNLKAANAELERKIELEERKLKLSQSENAKNFVNAVKAKQDQDSNPIWHVGNENYGDTETSPWKSEEHPDRPEVNPYDGDSQKYMFKYRLEEYKEAEANYQQALIDGNEEEAKRWKDRMDVLDKAMSGYTTELQSYLDELGDYDYSTLSDEAKQYVDYIMDTQNQYLVAVGSKDIAFNEIFSSSRFEQGRQAIEKLGKTGELTGESLKALYENNDSVKAMIDNMIEVGIIADANIESLDALCGDIAIFNSGLNVTSKTASQAKKDLKDLFSSINEQNKNKDNKDANTKVDDPKAGKKVAYKSYLANNLADINAYIESISEEEAQVALAWAKNVDKNSELTLTNLKKHVNGYKKAKKEYDKLVADAVKNGTGNSDKIQAAYEALLKYVGAIDTIDIKTETEDIGKFNTAVSESVSATGLSAESIEALKSRFQDLEGYDPSVLFEKTSGGVHLNTEALEGLENQFEETQKILIDNKLQDLIADYNSLQLQIDSCTDANRLAQLQSERDNKYQEIQNTKELEAEYAALTSAYNKWQQAKSGGDERDKYSNMGDSYSDIKSLVEQGWADDSEVTKYLDLMLNADKRTKDNIKDFDLLTQKIEGTDFSLMDFFQYDEDDKLTSEGLFNFLDAVKQKLGDEFVQIDEAGNYSFDFTGKKVEEVAKALGMSTEAVQIFEQALSDAGFNVMFSDTDNMIKSAREHAQDAIDKLEELQDKGKIKITESDGFKLEDFDVDTTDIEDLNNQITNAGKLLDKFRNKDGTVNLQLEGAAEAQNILITLIANKQALTAPAIMNIDTENLDEADKDVGNAIADVQEFINLSNQLELQKELKIDTTETEKKLKNAAKKLTPEVLAKVNIKDESVTNAINKIKGVDVKAGVHISQDSIDKVKSAVNGIQTKDLKIGDNSENVTNDLKIINDYTIEDKTFKVSVQGASEAYTSLYNINEQLTKLKNGSITITTTTTTKKGGGAKVTGSAFAQGNWGTKTGGTALFGELGREIIVDPITGSWHTVGDSGAEFAKYRKGSIVFNHKQTEELLGKGHTGRGKAFIGGNAFLNNGAQGSGGKRGSGGTHSVTDNGSDSSSSGSSGSSSGSSSSSEDKKLSSFRDWIDKFVDWIEVRIDRVQRKIDNAVDRAEQYVDNGSFTKAAAQYRKAISETQKQMENNSKGAVRYTKQANSVLNKASKGKNAIISPKQAKAIKKQVANGSIDIKKYNERQREVITEYKNLYEKSLSCSDALIELNENLDDYFEKLYNLPLDEASRKIDKLSDSLDVLTKKADAVSGGSNVYNRIVESNRKADMNAAKAAKKNAQKKVDKSADSLLSSLSGKAKKKAKAKIKKGKKVSLKGLKGKALKRAKAYNAAIDARNIASKEAKDATTAYNKAVAMRKKYAGKPSYMYENYLLGEETKNAKKQYQADQVAARKTSKNLTAAEKRKEKADAAVKRAKKGSKAYKKAKKEQQAAAKALRKARAANTTATQNAAQSEADYTKTLQENTKAMGDNIAKYHESVRAINAAKKSLYEAQNSLKTTKGINLQQSDFDSLIENARADITAAWNAYEAYLEWYNKNKNNLSDEDRREAEEKLLNLQTDVVNAQQALEELNNTKIQIPFDNLEEGIEILDALRNSLSAFVSLQNALGQDEGITSYIDQMTAAEEQAAKAHSEYEQAMENRNRAIRDPISGKFNKDMVYGGKSAEEWEAEANKYLAEEYKYLQESKEIALQLAAYLEEPFEKAIKRIEYFANILSGLGDLIDDEMLYDEDGKLTKHGITQVALLVEGYEAARDRIAEYSAELEQVNENYAKGYYNEEEYQERIEELNQAMLSGAKDMKTALDEVVKMYKEMAQAELDNLFELIDKRKEALDAKKA